METTKYPKVFATLMCFGECHGTVYVLWFLASSAMSLDADFVTLTNINYIMPSSDATL